MDDFELNNEEEYQMYSKIPFDEEPISRTNAKVSYSTRHARNSSSYNGEEKKPASRALTLIVSIMFVINIIFGGLIVRLFILSGTPKVITNSNVSISAEDSGAVWAAATKAKLSAVCVGAKYSGDVTYKTFFNMSSNGAGVITGLEKEAGNAIITTCYHVVSADTNKIYVLLFGSYTPIKATMVGFSEVYDIAVLKITGSSEVKESVASVCEVADSSLVSEGAMVVAVGNPLADGFSVTSGIISVPAKKIIVENQPEEMRVIQIDAAINPGNSGGGLFNNLGQFIGIVNAKSMDSLIYRSGSYSINSKEGVAFAIPSNIAYSLTNNILRNDGTPMAVSVGLTFKSGAEQDYIEPETGRSIQTVTYTASASAVLSGCMQDDKVVSFSYDYNGSRVTVDVKSVYDFDDHMFNITPGEYVTFNVLRGGANKTINLRAISVAVS
ncbi:MAG: trypsin-like peptidase domain-containing protein [Clostridia bacterium]|nr:trypsin-like peptidase domain-containing protein [Clostridia bacterium]